MASYFRRPRFHGDIRRAFADAVALLRNTARTAVGQFKPPPAAPTYPQDLSPKILPEFFHLVLLGNLNKTPPNLP